VKCSTRLLLFLNFFNFDEYFDQFSYILGGMQEKASEYQAFEKIIPYPLTAQKALILLRQALIPMFCNELAIDLRYSAMSDSAVQGFIPFSVGTNGNASAIVGEQPLFTQFFAEGVRAAHRMIANIKGVGVLDIVPLLGYFAAPIGARPRDYFWNNARTELQERCTFKIVVRRKLILPLCHLQQVLLLCTLMLMVRSMVP